VIKLVHITNVPENKGFFEGQLRYMASKGFEVHFVTSPGRSLADFAEVEGVQLHEVKVHLKISPLRDLVTIIQFVGVLRRIRPQIVHVHTPKAGFVAMIASWLSRVPVRIYHVHGLRFTTVTGLERLLIRSAEKLTFSLAHLALCVSGSVRAMAISERLCPDGKIKVLAAGSANGLDAVEKFNPAKLEQDARKNTREKFSVPPGAFVIGYVGRIIQDKGIGELAEAWATLREVFPFLHLLLVGSYQKEYPLPESTRAVFDTDPRIHVAGYLEDVAMIYASIDLLVLPSYREGFPNVVLEGSAMELPVVATRVCGCMDAIADGISGTLIPPKDTTALVEAISAYVRDPDLRRRHGVAGRLRVLNEFEPETLWNAIYDEYSHLLGTRQAPKPRGKNANGASEDKVVEYKA
jgi:glycosyltransferase involved in cell wall biosynthesis